ncbi:phosphosulfolactate synthase [Paenibacillus sp. GCM10023248]|uniref:phosphosulfolactate synthase n=1 Tax=Bacillales TaxID=1385 RepID=UPI002379C662|nr:MULTISPECIES: phosphosulfolactate synthase [Bacillales]MDD9267507.1 phosphosulfolactate synthase [Paenibacillus sp. MAHUQ-63]MDR6882725.1 phosphosulfolactate synthase [Bacillus sp. 3255]
MEVTSYLNWNPVLADPTGRRQAKPRTLGKTMVMDKGLGPCAFQDLLHTASHHVDMIKLGFGTSPLYPESVLKSKINLAKENGICIYPGGTFLEVAITQNAVDDYFDMVTALGFNGLEISNGTIDFSRKLRNELIKRGIEEGLEVVTEYGKKGWGSAIELEELIETVMLDTEMGAVLVTVEARESGMGVGIFDQQGKCKDEEVEQVLSAVPGDRLLWEAPLKSQQVHLINMLGPQIHLGNIAPHEIIALEALRRGLRSDTLSLGTRKD